MRGTIAPCDGSPLQLRETFECRPGEKYLVLWPIGKSHRVIRTAKVDRGRGQTDLVIRGARQAAARLTLIGDGVDAVANFREQDDDLEQRPLDGFGKDRLAAVGLEIGLFEFAGLKVPQLFDINGHG